MNKIMITMMAVMLLSVICAFAANIVVIPDDLIVKQGETKYTLVQTNPAEARTVKIDSIIDKCDTNDVCLNAVVNDGNGEIYVRFDEPSDPLNPLSTSTNSTGNAIINVTLSSTAPDGFYYRYYVSTPAGRYPAIAGPTVHNGGIPEFPTAAVPILMSMVGFGLVFRSKL